MDIGSIATSPQFQNQLLKTTSLCVTHLLVKVELIWNKTGVNCQEAITYPTWWGMSFHRNSTLVDYMTLPQALLEEHFDIGFVNHKTFLSPNSF